MIPKTLKNFNLFIDGGPLAGIAEAITLPKLSRKMEEFEAGGMQGPIEIDYGQEALSMEFELKEYMRAVIEQYGVADPAGINARFMGAYQGADQVDAVEITTRGRFKELDFGDAKHGESSPLKVTMPLTYFKYSVNNSVLIEIDNANNIFRVAGNDRNKEIRAAIGQ